jgi:hypothetical protein
MEKTFWQKLQINVIELLAKVHWEQKATLTPGELDFIRERCTKDYYIIATRKRNYLTTTLISIGNLILTGSWGNYSHVLMNLEDEVEVDTDFRFIEATGVGVHYSTFDEVFTTIDSVALVVPANMSVTEWTTALDRAKTYLGRPYDNLFDLKSDLEINCVELISLALSETADYETNFANFEKLVKEKKKITPDMFVDCPDFKVVYAAKR